MKKETAVGEQVAHEHVVSGGDGGSTAVAPKRRADGDFQEPFSPKTYKFAWRRKLAANPVSNHTYRIVVGVVGFIVTGIGVVAIPFPGPGWLIVFLGLGIWATEFTWAARLLNFAREKVEAWNDWMRPKPLWFKGSVALLTFAFVCFVVWLTLKLGGIPGFLPGSAKDFLQQMPGLG